MTTFLLILLLRVSPVGTADSVVSRVAELSHLSAPASAPGPLKLVASAPTAPRLRPENKFLKKFCEQNFLI